MCISFHVLSAAAADTAPADPSPDLSSLSIEDLARIDVSSVSKSDEPLSDAAAAVYVITHDDIMRSGATTIPEMLRLAPNLDVAQYDASTYAISARGFNGLLADKLLVLIDGRSVYSPLYAGVYWDTQEVLPEDVDRIEVISGPGGTLWGANAVNGVINIITKKADDTQGGLIDVGGGNLEQGGAIQYGGKAGTDASYRVYGTGSYFDSLESSAGARANDEWHRSQAGFRVDWKPAGDLVTVQGDLYDGGEDELGAGEEFLAGHNLLARWTHAMEAGSSLQVQAYVDDTRRFAAGSSGYAVDTYDLDLQHSFALAGWNSIVWGGGYRIYDYQIANPAAPGLQVLLPRSAMGLGNLFVEDTISVTNAVKLIPGIKLEWDPYVGLQPLPSIRASWKVDSDDLLWAAVSRAVRSPTPLDRNLVTYSQTPPFSRALVGGPDFESETLIAYEAGYRTQLSPRASLSLSLYDNVYQNLRTIEVNPAGGIYPLQIGNMMEGSAYGAEIWGDYRINDWWRLSAGFDLEHENLRLKPGGGGGVVPPVTDTILAGDDPHHQAQLRSSMNIVRDVAFDLDLREVGSLPDPAVSSYVELDSRLGWTVTHDLELSIAGFNLLRAQHLEFANPPSAVEIGRSFYANARLRF